MSTSPDDLELLFRRELPALRTWALANVPSAVRRAGDADDFVQIAMLRTLRRLPHLRAAEEGTLQPYLRQVLRNLVRDYTRAMARQPPMRPLEDWDQQDDSSPLAAMLAAEAYSRYRLALASLSPRAQEAVRARLERGLDYAAVARCARCASTAAARVLVGRALTRMATHIRSAGVSSSVIFPAP